MSAERGQVNVAMLLVVTVLVGAGVAALLVFQMRGRESREVEPALTVAEQAAEPGSGIPDQSGAMSDTGAVAAHLPRLLDLGGETCVPCKMMAPILEELRTTYAGKLHVDVIDVWKDKEAAKTYAVKVIPTQIFFDASGTERFRHQGFFSREEILAKWKELGVDLDG